MVTHPAKGNPWNPLIGAERLVGVGECHVVVNKIWTLV
jgi:hypothetical protein